MVGWSGKMYQMDSLNALQLVRSLSQTPILMLYMLVWARLQFEAMSHMVMEYINPLMEEGPGLI